MLHKNFFKILFLLILNLDFILNTKKTIQFLSLGVHYCLFLFFFFWCLAFINTYLFVVKCLDPVVKFDHIV